MQLNIRCNPSSGDLKLTMDQSKTVFCLRQALAKELKVPLDRFYLCYDQETLSDDNTLEDYGVQSGAVLFCVIRPPSDQVLSVRLDDGAILPVTYQITDTVQKIKRIIGEMAYGRRCPMLVFFKGVLMEDAKMLKDCGIVPKCELAAYRQVL